jgi:hypothetical protein
LAYDLENSSGFKVHRHAANNADDCTAGGKLFQMRDAEGSVTDGGASGGPDVQTVCQCGSQPLSRFNVSDTL